MKQLLLVFTFILTTILSQAKIWRVNNTGAAADFTTAQAAHNGASSGDTLHFEASGTTYGSLSVSKQLYIFGNGYFLGTLSSNSNADLQANPSTSHVGTVTFAPGSNGSVIMGMNIDYLPVTSCSNIMIRRNWISTNNGVSLSSCSSIQFTQNFLAAGAPFSAASATNIQVNNNIMGYYVSMDANSSGDFMNNIVSWGNPGGITATNFRIWNNILLGGAVTMTSCDVRNNIGNSTQFGTLNGNQQNVTMTTVFNDLPNTDGNYSEDSRFTLKAGSPAIGAANGGGDIGAFGTAQGTAYVLSGIPNIPAIYKLTAPATVNTNTINITISTRTNQ